MRAELPLRARGPGNGPNVLGLHVVGQLRPAEDRHARSEHGIRHQGPQPGVRDEAFGVRGMLGEDLGSAGPIDRRHRLAPVPDPAKNRELLRRDPEWEGPPARSEPLSGRLECLPAARKLFQHVAGERGRRARDLGLERIHDHDAGAGKQVRQECRGCFAQGSPGRVAPRRQIDGLAGVLAGKLRPQGREKFGARVAERLAATQRHATIPPRFPDLSDLLARRHAPPSHLGKIVVGGGEPQETDRIAARCPTPTHLGSHRRRLDEGEQGAAEKARLLARHDDLGPPKPQSELVFDRIPPPPVRVGECSRQGLRPRHAPRPAHCDGARSAGMVCSRRMNWGPALERHAQRGSGRLSRHLGELTASLDRKPPGCAEIVC